MRSAKPVEASGSADRQSGVGEKSMRREIGTLLAILVVINATIGTGIFKTPAKVARMTGSLTASMLVWVAGGAIALAGALSLAELAAAIPRTGGVYEYLRRAYGPRTAFVLGWTKLTLLIPSAVGSFAKLAAEALAATCGWAPDPARDGRIAMGFILVATSANLLGVRSNAIQQAVITVAKYAGVAFLGLIGLLAVIPQGAHVEVPADAPAFATHVTLAGCFGALVSVMWAYDGWADLSTLSGEVKQPARTLPRALALGTLGIVAVYLVAILGYGRVLGLEGLQRSTTGSNMAASNLAVLAAGPTGRIVLGVLVLLSCLGGCMSSLLTGPRVFVAMASDHLFPAWLGSVSRSVGVPRRAVLIAAMLGVFYVGFRSFEQLTEAFVYGFFPFYMLAVVAVFILRRREPNLPRPFKVPGYPVTPLLFLLGGFALLAGASASIDRTAAFAFAVVLVGVPVSFLWTRLGRTPRGPVAPPPTHTAQPPLGAHG
ncbi:MAG: APC family permease [Polyangiaceae bacterium]